jgi:hypothetical protein
MTIGIAGTVSTDPSQLVRPGFGGNVDEHAPGNNATLLPDAARLAAPAAQDPSTPIGPSLIYTPPSAPTPPATPPDKPQ